MDRGDLTGTYPNYTGISGTPAAERDYTLDALGNWTDYIEKSSGSTTLDQDRTHNSVNEITDITENEGDPWIDPAHDARGNMTTVPKPSDLDLAGGFTCKYDSWNRLAEVKQGETVVAKYEYDALNRRVKKHIDTQSPADPNGVEGSRQAQPPGCPDGWEYEEAVRRPDDKADVQSDGESLT